MRILQVSPGYYPAVGGGERHVQALNKCLVGLGHKVTVATMVQEKSLPRFEVIQGVELQRFPAVGPQAYRFPIGLFRYLWQHGPTFDVVHAHNYHSLPLLFTVIACQGRTVVSPYYHGRGHSFAADVLHRIYAPLASSLLQRVRSVICLSSGEAEQVVRNLGISQNRITIIPSGVTSAKQHLVPDVESQAGLLLSVGRLEGYKRVDRIIAALQYLPEHYTLAVAGLGPAQSKLERQAQGLGIHHRVHFLSRVSDEELQIFYHRAQAVVSLSEFESFGITVLEALDSGCHVVCSDIPAFRDFSSEFPDMVSLVSSGASDEEVAAVIQSAMVKPRQTVSLQRYDWGKIVAEHLKVYTFVTAQNK